MNADELEVWDKYAAAALSASIINPENVKALGSHHAEYAAAMADNLMQERTKRKPSQAVPAPPTPPAARRIKNGL